MKIVRNDGVAAVHFEWIEVYHAASVGIRRRIAALKHGRNDNWGAVSKDPWDREVEGACGEMALAAFKDRYWHAIASNLEGLPGDAGNYEVRTTSLDHGCLIVKPKEEPTKRFYLITGSVALPYPVLTIRGSMLASDAQKEKYWRPELPRPAFLVPQSDLDPLQ